MTRLILAVVISIALAIAAIEANSDSNTDNRFDTKGAISRLVRVYKGAQFGKSQFIGTGFFFRENMFLSAGHVCEEYITVLTFYGSNKPMMPVRRYFSKAKPDVCIIETALYPKIKPLKMGPDLRIENAPVLRLFQLGFPQNFFEIKYIKLVGYREYGEAGNLFLVNRALIPGASGGPVFYEDSSLAGIVFGFSNIPIPHEQGLGLITPVQDVKKWLDEREVYYDE